MTALIKVIIWGGGNIRHDRHLKNDNEHHCVSILLCYLNKNNSTAVSTPVTLLIFNINNLITQ